MAPEKREAFAEATGVNFRQARVWVFLISSAALGFIGGFYTSNFGGVAFSIFNFDTVLLGLAMLVIGGVGRAEGAVVGTLIVVFFDQVLNTWGPARFMIIGLIMLLVVLYLRNGLFGIKAQFRAWRDKKKSERRSTRAEKGGSDRDRGQERHLPAAPRQDGPRPSQDPGVTADYRGASPLPQRAAQ